MQPLALAAGQLRVRHLLHQGVSEAQRVALACDHEPACDRVVEEVENVRRWLLCHLGEQADRKLTAQYGSLPQRTAVGGREAVEAASDHRTHTFRYGASGQVRCPHQSQHLKHEQRVPLGALLHRVQQRIVRSVPQRAGSQPLDFAVRQPAQRHLAGRPLTHDRRQYASHLGMGVRLGAAVQAQHEKVAGGHLRHDDLE
jgi:hypothetical protein